MQLELYSLRAIVRGGVNIMFDRTKEIAKKLAKQQAELDRERRINPLDQYSTSQLKAELRRRKIR